ncbi:MAG: hypothetical protein LAO79_27395 [Acidobacteriia bacterium]|nr:hypothetical protein [Terriglobia bacterium]
MRIRITILFAIALAGLVIAQEQPGVPDGLPWPRGVYLRTGSDWIQLPANPLMPFLNGDARWLLGFGHSDPVAEMPGPHALVQLGNGKPMFYLRGLPASNGIYLVRSEPKEDYRQIRMPRSRDFRQFTRLRQQDMIELDMRAISGDVLSATPRTELKPGEYAIVSVFEQNLRQIRASFDFGVSGK